MARRLIGFTEDSTLRQTIPASLSFSYIRTLVEQHLGADAAAMLSEPQIVPREGRHQWLTEAALDAPLVRFDQASPEQAASARRTLDDVRWRARTTWESLGATGNEQSRQQALAILRAFQVPQDSEYVWLIGERPLLVGWGHEKANIIPLEPSALALTYRRPVSDDAPPRASVATKSEQALPPVASAHFPANRRRRWLPIFLWLLFCALAFALGGLLLPACSIGIPGTEWRWTWSARCEASAQNLLADLNAQNRSLKAGLRAQQIALQARDFCPTSARVEPTLPDANLPSLPPNADIRAPIQVRLDWNTDDDLDLIIKCPSGGWISPLHQHQRDESCGDGKRDLDANHKMTKRDYPTTEHIRWYDIRPGRYRVVVWPVTTVSGSPIPFRVTLGLFGQTKTCPGEVVWDDQKGEGYSAYIIDFDPAAPLPSCNVGSTAAGRLQVCTTGCGKD